MLGDYPIFSWKSKAAQKKEQEEYEEWAFPYGQKQRDNLTARLLEAFPKENIPTTLIPFLTCKELYGNVLKNTGSRDEALNKMINDMKKYKRLLTKKTMPVYLAFVLADAEIGEDAEYPPLAEILERAGELAKLKRDD